MNISPQTTINSTIHLSNLIRAQYSPGRIALPTRAGMYTRLKHVQGVPTQIAGAGYSISKLRMIDLLVDRLVRLKGQPMESPTVTSDAEADALVMDYAHQISQALSSASPLAQSFSVVLAEPGLILNLVAKVVAVISVDFAQTRCTESLFQESSLARGRGTVVFQGAAQRECFECSSRVCPDRNQRHPCVPQS